MVNLQTERYSACHVLSSHTIPCYIWAEDALHHYGVRTGLFTLQIIVQDTEAAAKLLMDNGWALEPETVRPATIADKAAKFLRKRHKTQDADQLIALLPSSEWNITLPTSVSDETMIPSLPDTVDALIDRWLDASDENLQFRMILSVYLCYLYEYNERLKSRDFAQEIKLEHRQFHFDALAGASIGTLGFQKHQIKIRELLRNGKFELCECSVDRNDETIFTELSLAKLQRTKEANTT